MNKEILEVVASVSMEKGVDKEIIFEALEEAIASASKKLLDDEALVNVVIDRKTGDYNTFRAWEIVDEVMNEVNEITEADVDKQEIVDGFAKVEIENIDFGRISAQACAEILPKSIFSISTLANPSTISCLSTSASVISFTSFITSSTISQALNVL